MNYVIILLFGVLSTGGVSQRYIGADVPTYKESVSLKGETYETGLVMPKDWKKGLKKSPVKMGTMALPDKFSWKDKMTPIRNQGSCGSCWSFAMTGVLENVVGLHGGGVIDLSEQYLVSCDRSNNGCGGGWMEYKVYNTTGAVYEKDFPYTARNSRCKSGLKYHHKIKDWYYVDKPNVEKLKQAIYEYGPISVGCSASWMKGYRSGIFNRRGGRINHAVILVGWDDTVKPAHWIMRNSWGTNWGEDGYMRAAYGAANMATVATYIDYNGPVPHGVIPTPTPTPDPEPTPTPDPEPEPDPDGWPGRCSQYGLLRGLFCWLFGWLLG